MTDALLDRANLFVQDLDRRIGPEVLHRSALGPNHPDTGLHRPDVQRMLATVQRWKPTHMVEIGTHYAVTAAVLGMVCERVTTFNLLVYRQWIVPAILRIAGVSNVTECLPRNDIEKGEMLMGMDFDAAFVDGMHAYRSLKFDFEQVRKCGRVIFHDLTLTRPPRPDVARFVGELAASGDGTVTHDDMFAYWTAKGKA